MYLSCAGIVSAFAMRTIRQQSSVQQQSSVGAVGIKVTLRRQEIHYARPLEPKRLLTIFHEERRSACCCILVSNRFRSNGKNKRIGSCSIQGSGRRQLVFRFLNLELHYVLVDTPRKVSDKVKV